MLGQISRHQVKLAFGLLHNRPPHPMPLLPKTPAEWTRSFAVPLFMACILIATTLLFGGLAGGRQWRYWGGPIARVLLPSLGVALGLTCMFGKGLPRDFRITASAVAGLSTFCGWMLQPALAE